MKQLQHRTRADSFKYATAWRMVIYLLALTTSLVCWTYLVLIGILAADYVLASAAGVITVFLFWYAGSTYISVPVAYSFHTRYHKGEYLELEKMHRKAIKLLEKSLLRRERALAITTANLALLRLCQGDFDESVELFSRAHSYAQKNKRFAKTVSALIVKSNLAAAMLRRNQYFDAEPIASSALEIAESARIQKRYPILAAPPLTTLASMSMRLGELEHALEKYKRALEICETTPVPRVFSRRTFEQCKLQDLLGLAIVTARLKRISESEIYCDRFWELADQDKSLLSTLFLDNLNVLANEYVNSKLFERAERLLELAYAIGHPYPDHPDARQLLNYYEKLLLLTDRQFEVSDMRRWLRPVGIKAIASS